MQSLIEETLEQQPTGRPSVDVNTVFNSAGSCGLDLCGSGWGPVAEINQNCTDPFGSARD
jgi:hypothetical protein